MNERREYIVEYECDGSTMFEMGLRDRIVRCRDCKHMHVYDVSSIYGNHEHDTEFCLRFVDGMRMTVEPDGYCWLGEREGAASSGPRERGGTCPASASHQGDDTTGVVG